jgi:hypothetical protein
MTKVRDSPQLVRFVRCIFHMTRCSICITKIRSMLVTNTRRNGSGLTRAHIAPLLRGFHHYNNCPNGCKRSLCISIRRFIQKVVSHRQQRPVCDCDACGMWNLIMSYHARRCGSKKCRVPYNHCHRK